MEDTLVEPTLPTPAATARSQSGFHANTESIPIHEPVLGRTPRAARPWWSSNMLVSLVFYGAIWTISTVGVLFELVRDTTNPFDASSTGRRHPSADQFRRPHMLHRPFFGSEGAPDAHWESRRKNVDAAAAHFRLFASTITRSSTYGIYRYSHDTGTGIRNARDAWSKWGTRRRCTLPFQDRGQMDT